MKALSVLLMLGLLALPSSLSFPMLDLLAGPNNNNNNHHNAPGPDTQLLQLLLIHNLGKHEQSKPSPGPSQPDVNGIMHLMLLKDHIEQAQREQQMKAKKDEWLKMSQVLTMMGLSAHDDVWILDDLLRSEIFDWFFLPDEAARYDEGRIARIAHMLLQNHLTLLDSKNRQNTGRSDWSNIIQLLPRHAGGSYGTPGVQPDPVSIIHDMLTRQFSIGGIHDPGMSNGALQWPNVIDLLLSHEHGQTTPDMTKIMHLLSLKSVATPGTHVGRYKRDIGSVLGGTGGTGDLHSLLLSSFGGYGQGHKNTGRYPDLSEIIRLMMDQNGGGMHSSSNNNKDIITKLVLLKTLSDKGPVGLNGGSNVNGHNDMLANVLQSMLEEERKKQQRDAEMKAQLDRISQLILQDHIQNAAREMKQKQEQEAKKNDLTHQLVQLMTAKSFYEHLMADNNNNNNQNTSDDFKKMTQMLMLLKLAEGNSQPASGNPSHSEDMLSTAMKTLTMKCLLEKTCNDKTPVDPSKLKLATVLELLSQYNSGNAGHKDNSNWLDDFMRHLMFHKLFVDQPSNSTTTTTPPEPMTTTVSP